MTDGEVQRLREENARLLKEMMAQKHEMGEEWAKEYVRASDLESENGQLRAELDENSRVIRALRRQRDIAEDTIRRVRAVLGDEQKINASDLRAALKGPRDHRPPRRTETAEDR